MGRNGAGKTTLLRIVAGCSRRTRRSASRRVLRWATSRSSRSTSCAPTHRLEQLQADFPREGIGVLRTLAGASSYRRRRRQEGAGVVGRRALASRDGAHAVRDPELPSCSRADHTSTWRPRRCWSIARRSRERCSSCRTTAPSCAVSGRGCSSWAARAAATRSRTSIRHLRRVCRAYGHEAPGTHS